MSIKDTSKRGLIRYEIRVSIQTDRGCVRAENEDCGRHISPRDLDALAERGVLTVVADGMGGHSSGEVASNLAVEAISRLYYQRSGDPQTALVKAFQEANLEIYQAALDDASLWGMGTTCTALALQEGVAYSAHVGDTRIYLVRDGHINLLTEDHSAVMEMVKLGLISLEEARHHGDKNVIIRALGTAAEVEVSVWDKPLLIREGDCFLLCSDGLYDLVEDGEIEQAVVLSDPQSAGEKLIALAKERGGHDNITVGVVSVRPAGHAQTRRLRDTREAEVRLK